MKGLLCFLLVLALMLMCSACSFSSGVANTHFPTTNAAFSTATTDTDSTKSAFQDAASSPTKPTSPSSNSSSTPSQDNLSDENQQFSSLINTISANNGRNIQSVRMSHFMFEEPWTSSSREVIDQWIQLLRDCKISTIPYEPIYGGGFELSFQSSSNDIEVGTFLGNYIFLPNQKTVMLNIDNYDELRPRFKKVEKAMGYPLSE